LEFEFPILLEFTWLHFSLCPLCGIPICLFRQFRECTG